jgi:hypothetical protein
LPVLSKIRSVNAHGLSLESPTNLVFAAFNRPAGDRGRGSRAPAKPGAAVLGDTPAPRVRDRGPRVPPLCSGSSRPGRSRSSRARPGSADRGLPGHRLRPESAPPEAAPHPWRPASGSPTVGVMPRRTGPGRHRPGGPDAEQSV